MCKLAGMPVRIGHKRARSRRRTFLKEWRLSKNLTLEKASERFGMSAGQLSRIENGKSDVTLGFLEIASEAYGTSIASLLDRKPGEKDPAQEQIRAIQEILDKKKKTGT